MTDEELDLLASAYVDGEATHDEVAMVERDPELQARVELFRSVQVEEDGAGATPPAGLVDRHLNAALAEFEAIRGAASGATEGTDTPDEVGRTAPVVDLRNASRRARTMPSWLPAAAGFVIVGGGFLWAVGQTGGDDDSAETASLAIDEGEADTTSAQDSDATMTAMSDDAMEESDEAMEADAMEEATEDGAMAESDSESGRAAGADESAAAPAEGDSDDDSAEDTEDAEDELVEPEPLLFFDEIPDVDAILDLPDPETDIERSLCGPEIITTTLGSFVGFIPVVVQERPAEIYLFEDGDGAEIRLLIDEACQPIQP